MGVDWGLTIALLWCQDNILYLHGCYLDRMDTHARKVIKHLVARYLTASVITVSTEKEAQEEVRNSVTQETNRC